MSKLTKDFASKLLFSCLILYFVQKYTKNILILNGTFQCTIEYYNGTCLIHNGTRHFIILVFSSGPGGTVCMDITMDEVIIYLN